MSIPNEAPPDKTTFADFIVGCEDGELHAELTEQLRKIARELTDHVMAYGGAAKGRLSLKLDFKLKDNLYEIVAAVDTSLPRTPRGRSIMWSLKDGSFVGQNPRQMTMWDPQGKRLDKPIAT
ncbi:MAG TPA: hypothetical protein VGO34_14740 [Alphaproteobacteria bacterium]|jgi:hypothetical protein